MISAYPISVSKPAHHNTQWPAAVVSPAPSSSCTDVAEPRVSVTAVPAEAEQPVVPAQPLKLERHEQQLWVEGRVKR